MSHKTYYAFFYVALLFPFALFEYAGAQTTGPDNLQVYKHSTDWKIIKPAETVFRGPSKVQAHGAVEVKNNNSFLIHVRLIGEFYQKTNDNPETWVLMDIKESILATDEIPAGKIRRLEDSCIHEFKAEKNGVYKIELWLMIYKCDEGGNPIISTAQYGDNMRNFFVVHAQ